MALSPLSGLLCCWYLRCSVTKKVKAVVMSWGGGYVSLATMTSRAIVLNPGVATHTGVTYQTPCVSDIHSVIENSSTVAVTK